MNPYRGFRDLCFLLRMVIERGDESVWLAVFIWIAVLEDTQV